MSLILVFHPSTVTMLFNVHMVLQHSHPEIGGSNLFECKKWCQICFCCIVLQGLGSAYSVQRGAPNA